MSSQPAGPISDAPADHAGDAAWAAEARLSLQQHDAKLFRRFEQGENPERLIALRARAVDAQVCAAWRRRRIRNCSGKNKGKWMGGWQTERKIRVCFFYC